jgi:riboflavin synthase
MFTGIVAEVGELVEARPEGTIVRLAVASTFDRAGIALGASIACAGVCLTVTGTDTDARGRTLTFFDAAPETLKITTAGSWTAGMPLNLERALRMGDELGGHLVAGHVDGLATIVSREDLGEAVRFTFAAPPNLARFIAPKGSVCLDGTSLTVNEVEGAQFSCLLIPHTLSVTTWGARTQGDAVNLEVDLMARYAARLAEAGSLG